MTKAEKAIMANVKNSNGLTNPVLAAQMTGYKVSTARRIFRNFLNASKITVEMINGFNHYHVAK